MFGKILSILSGIVGFTNYVADYFRDKRIRETATTIAALKNKVVILERSLKNCQRDCESKIDALNIEHDLHITMLKAEHEKNLDKSSRRISG